MENIEQFNKVYITYYNYPEKKSRQGWEEKGGQFKGRSGREGCKYRKGNEFLQLNIYQLNVLNLTILQGAHRYGLAETDLFQSADLYEGRKGMFLNIINCLNRLGFLVSFKN